MARTAGFVTAIGLLAFGLLVLGGCGNSATDDPADDGRPFTGVTLTVAVPPQSGFAQAWDSLLIEWTARTGAEVKVVEVATAELAGTANSGTNSTAETPSPALFIVPTAELSELVAAGKLASIPRSVQGIDGVNWNDIAPGLAAAVGSVERRPTAVPLSSPVLVLYYRRDLLEAAGLSPPETWDDYQKLVDSLDRWAPGLTAVEPWSDDFRATMFLARAAAAGRPTGQLSFFFDIESGEPLADSPPFVRTCEQSITALRKLPKDAPRLTPSECRRRILAGTAALAIAYETARNAGVTETPSSDSPRAEGASLGFAPLPGTRSVYNRSIAKWETPAGNPVNRPGVTGFAGLSASVSAAASEAEAQAAWNLLSTLTAPGNFELAFPGAFRSPCRTSQLESPEGWTGPELTSAEAAEYLKVVGDILRDPGLIAELPVPGAAAFRTHLSEGLSDAFPEKATEQPADGEPSDEKATKDTAAKPTASAADTMKTIQERWSAEAKSRGTELLRDTYRRRLGIPAK